jgi:hypothetical protein
MLLYRAVHLLECTRQTLRLERVGEGAEDMIDGLLVIETSPTHAQGDVYVARALQDNVDAVNRRYGVQCTVTPGELGGVAVVELDGVRMTMTACGPLGVHTRVEDAPSPNA